MIPKNPKEKASYYRSREYKKVLRSKFSKWSHSKAASVYFNNFTCTFNPYALDWLDNSRSKVKQARADAMFDTMEMMLRIRVDEVPDKTKHKAINKALQAWAHRQQRSDGREYTVVEGTILPKK